ncbi:MAG: tRNA (adenosine(37)-N6)-threonylcarbamoyltransferase complex dimerization subunit type 1 TsaB [Hyphomicrobiales bacterium]|nr:tRNA (adenosine(37)-N6)-threonylcarbamoyltransferase complex dimerization subunit type 1 TsaB [Hyphomicrobiales bacterium]MCP5372105.1 tRNA (adenosine(37)-N6)-threonylcarbamoyltransferase complex dimerization subunit type 1 TsaB [Hyphomicrobiales bacterium]
MQILAFDTAAAACSAALWRDGTVRARRLEPMARGQAEALLPMVRAVLDEAGAAFADLDLLAVTVGPGAFTGLRIGLAAARGLALATGLPCLGVTTLEAVAQAVPAAARTGDAILAVLDTRRDDVYAQTFGNDLNPLDAPRAVDPAALDLPAGVRAPVAAGDGAALLPPALAARAVEVAAIDAATVAELAARRWRPGTPLTPPEPLYLRPPMATVPVAGGRLRP